MFYWELVEAQQVRAALHKPPVQPFLSCLRAEAAAAAGCFSSGGCAAPCCLGAQALPHPNAAMHVQPSKPPSSALSCQWRVHTGSRRLLPCPASFRRLSASRRMRTWCAAWPCTPRASACSPALWMGPSRCGCEGSITAAGCQTHDMRLADVDLCLIWFAHCHWPKHIAAVSMYT